MPRGPIRRPASGVVIDPEKLIRMRDERAMTRLELAEAVGQQQFSPAALNQIELGKLDPGARTLQVIYAVLHDQKRPAEGLVAESSSIAALRETKGWSQRELAGEVGRQLFSRDAIAKIENGTRRPKASTLRALCQALNCEPRDLLPD